NVAGRPVRLSRYEITMAEALRRLLWSVPLLVALTVVLFSVLSRLNVEHTESRVPLFYNPTPTSAEQAANTAVRDVLNNEVGADQRLVELGGAALPYVLESLAKRPLADQQRIAEALWPLTNKIGHASAWRLLRHKRSH